MANPKEQVWTTFSVEKSTEGGLTKADYKYLVESIGLKMRWSYSPYVGQWGMDVNTKDPAKIKELETLLWG